MTDAALVVTLANARTPRRPSHARTAAPYDALATAASASELLERFVGRPIVPRELPALRALQRAVLAAVDALIDGSKPPPALNALAVRQPVIYALERNANGKWRAALRPKRASSCATLVITAIGELGELEPSRLRRCGRRECSLVFYDTTRSATRRWHAERPCGLRERLRRHRSK